MFFTMSNMKNKSILTAVAVLALAVSGCNKPAADPAVLDKDTSYAMGMIIASQIAVPGMRYDYQAFAEGFKAFVEAEETRFSMEEGMEKINVAFAKYFEAQAEGSQAEFVPPQTEADLAQAEANLAEGEAFLLENGAKGGVITTSSGLQYEVITEGNGPKPVSADMVRVNYEGTFLDGTIFDSSYERGTPVEFYLNQVIRGWTEGLQLMSEGGEYRFFIPANLAYGERGNERIPPNSVLVFRVELLSIFRDEADFR
jgi:FKBP-type peptidyl-prolyl cis-trans isomerase